MSDAHWMEKAFANAGKPGHSLHKSLGVAEGKKIPAGKVYRASHSKDAHLRRMAQAAENANKVRKPYGK